MFYDLNIPIQQFSRQDLVATVKRLQECWYWVNNNYSPDLFN